MNIHALNLTCDRDFDLSSLMLKSFQKHCPYYSDSILRENTDCWADHYGNGAGWQASMMKLNHLRRIVPADDDFVLSVDSDVLFTSGEVFKHINTSYGIIGIKHRPEFQVRFGRWSHMSGALIFLRGDIAKKICSLSTADLNTIRHSHFKYFNLTENEDVIISYLATYVGANQFDLGAIPNLSSGNFESDLVLNDLKSFYHLNYCPTEFLGEPVDGKWQLPKVMEKKGYRIC